MTAPNVTAQKRELRRELRSYRKSLSPHLQSEFSENIFQHVLHSEIFLSSQRIGLYASDEGEVLTRSIFDHARMLGKKTFFPVVTPSGLSFREVREWKALTPGFKNILEPAFGKEIGVSALDLLFAPGVAFDYLGNRVGRGGGYYDRLIGNLNRPRFVAALAYSFQLRSSVPKLEHDSRVDFVVTENGWVRT